MEPVATSVVVKKPPLFQHENSDPHLDSMLRTGRVNSADIVRNVEKRRKKRSNRSKKSTRSKSVGESSHHFMRTLTVEKTDVLSTPLSSLRSCSEYNRGNTAQGFIPKAVEIEVRRGFWSTFFFWPSDDDPKKSGKQPTVPVKKKQQHRVRFRSRDNEEQSFLVDRLRFNEANLRDGEDYDYHSSNMSPDQQRRRHSSNSSDSSWQQEEAEYYFGVKKALSKCPMEIELTTYKIEYFDVYTEPPTTVSATARFPSVRNLPGFGSSLSEVAAATGAFDSQRSRHPSQLQLAVPFDADFETELDPELEDFGLRLSGLTSPTNVYSEQSAVAPGMSPGAGNVPTSVRRVTSFRTLERVPSHVPSPVTVTRSALAQHSLLQQFNRQDSTVATQSYCEQVWKTWMSGLRRIYNEEVSWFANANTSSSAEPATQTDALYDILRIQPFTCGAYLRGMLLAGLSSTVFQLYSLLTWPDWTSKAVSLSQTSTLGLQHILYFLLVVQLLCNIGQFPFRVRLHFACWVAARCSDTESALSTIRTMLHSDAWMINRLLGLVLDFSSVCTLVLSEGYFWACALLQLSALHSLEVYPDMLAMRSLLLSLCATNVLTWVSRIVVAVAYSWSLNDPFVLQEARRRGMSTYDLDALPTFVYAAKEDASTEDCAICLCSFDLGEMLIALPCHTSQNNLMGNSASGRHNNSGSSNQNNNNTNHHAATSRNRYNNASQHCTHSTNHCFHAQCIRTWLTRQNSCPLCQRVI
jgi:hypothetical protein